MRLIMLLMLPPLAFAAPVPKQPQKPDVELSLSANDPLVLAITIQNNSKEPLELPYRVTPFEHLVIDLYGQTGKHVTIEQTHAADAKANPGTLTIPPGQSKILSQDICPYMHKVADPEEKITFTARLRLVGKTVESKPLTVEP